MANSPRICVVGSCNIDLTFRTPRLPVPGETLVGTVCHLGFGGKGANQAVAAARLGGRVTMVGKVGRDAFGEKTLDNFRAENVDATFVTVAGEQSTGVAAIIVDDAARNAILVVPGANHELSADDVRRAERAIQAADILLCQLEVPVETIFEAFRIAKAAGVKTVLNPAPAATLQDDLLRLADLCIPNETELQQLTGQSAGTLEQATRAGQVLLKRGPSMVIVTRGDQGALIVEPHRIESVPGVSAQAVDSSGAGDAFIGGFAVFSAEGRPLRESVQRANHVAALSVTRLGTQASFPRREEADKSFNSPASIEA
jgi:ribokinase